MSKSPSKPLRIADLKANLSRYLRDVRGGKTLVVYDRDTPVARIVPVSATPNDLPGRKATASLADVRLPAPLGRDIDILGALREERRERT